MTESEYRETSARKSNEDTIFVLIVVGVIVLVFILLGTGFAVMRVRSERAIELDRAAMEAAKAQAEQANMQRQKALEAAKP